MSDPRAMTGVWYGRYASRVDPQENGYIALIEEAGGALSGTISEPDGYGGVRRASVAGTRNGAQIRFVKQYIGRWRHAVFYEGSVDDHGTEANGSWQLDGIHGGFSMQREKFSDEALEAEDAETLELR